MEQAVEQRDMDFCERVYQNALLLMEGRLYSEAADELARVPGYRDADDRRRFCEEKKATAQLDRIYEEAEKAAANRNVRSQEKAIQFFETIIGYRNADERIEQAKRTIEQIRQKERADREAGIRAAQEAERKRKKRNRRIVAAVVAGVLVVAACLAGRSLYDKYVVPELQYRRGVKEMEAGAYDEAYRTLHGMDYRDSSDLVYQLGKERLEDAQVGDTVFFGAYPQGHVYPAHRGFGHNC